MESFFSSIFHHPFPRSKSALELHSPPSSTPKDKILRRKSDVRYHARRLCEYYRIVTVEADIAA
ncbi:hypothetical protein CCACVL1_26843 [Corchorus capsularis]|uniref:Uncharacterized protein n=1 Tax=Corchorus capsularis TaxID=210143 RepID=A0A1R3GD13_COCAP|nr:hypothetical protein CCACVL1_26843 [Corchorus capsularis]